MSFLRHSSEDGLSDEDSFWRDWKICCMKNLKLKADSYHVILSRGGKRSLQMRPSLVVIRKPARSLVHLEY